MISILTLALALPFTGIVHDSTGLPLPGAAVELIDEASGRTTVTTTAVDGTFTFPEPPPGRHRLRVSFPGFEPYERLHTLDLGHREHVRVVLEVLSLREQVSVQASGIDLPSSTTMQSTIDRGFIETLPSQSVSGGLSAVITFAAPGVAADSNGGFHPLGEHAEASFSVDGQPIADQQSRTFSNQLSAAAIQSLEVLTGVPPPEFGDKTSLVVKATTRSGLSRTRPAGTAAMAYGSFESITGSFTLGAGTERFGNFVSYDTYASNRFLDTPEAQSLHARGHVHNLFDRFDARLAPQTSLQLNVFAATSQFQSPNTFDQQDAGQDQRQRQQSVNFAPSLTHTFGPRTALDAHVWFRRDVVRYDGSEDRSHDRPAFLSQRRSLLNAGVKAAVSQSAGRHTLKAGFQETTTWLDEEFQTGLTDPGFNPPCFTQGGSPATERATRDPRECGAIGLVPNTDFLAGLMPHDLTRGGTLFEFGGRGRVTQWAAYAQDSMKLADFELMAGLRFDAYDGLSTATGLQPRLGASYRMPGTGTLLRASYGRIFLTPYNENLVLASSTGGLLGSVGESPLTAGRRHQVSGGAQHRFGNGVQIDGEYFWKFTEGAFDFDIILNTPLAFPVQFRRSEVDGGLVRVALPVVHGWRAFTTLAHTRARLFGPALGGLRFSADYAPVARPDHDQAFQQTTHLEYHGRRGFWAGVTWRYDSGLVAVSVPTFADALRLTGDEQAAVGLFCGDVTATRAAPLRSCSAASFGARLINIPAPGTENDDTNPTRIVPRHLVDVSSGVDLGSIGAARVDVRLTVLNLFNRVALYNFLSTFSGTHFVTPRSARADFTFRF